MCAADEAAEAERSFFTRISEQSSSSTMGGCAPMTCSTLNWAPLSSASILSASVSKAAADCSWNEVMEHQAHEEPAEGRRRDGPENPPARWKIERTVDDVEFAKRRAPWMISAIKMLKATRLLGLASLIPANCQPLMDVRLTKLC